MKRILLKMISRGRSLGIIMKDLVLSRSSMIPPIFLLLKLELVVKDGTLAVFVGCSTVPLAIVAFRLFSTSNFTYDIVCAESRINLQTLLASPTHRISLLSTTMLQLDEGDHQTRQLRLSGTAIFSSRYLG